MNNYVQLGELIKTISKTHKFDKEKLVFLNTSDVSEGKILINHYMPVSELKGQAKKTIKNGDILYSEIRPKNKRYAYVKNLKNPEDYVISTKLMVLRNSSKDLDTDYLYHFLTYEETLNYLQRRAENRIGSFPQITFDVLKTLQIWLPEINAQKQIAKVLSDLDAKIEVNNRINQELEAMAKTLYDYWFVQFDFPFVTSSGVEKPYKSSGGKMVYNDELKREIPEGWKIKTLGDFAEIKRGKLITEKTANLSGNIKVVSAGLDYSYLHDNSNREKYTITVSGSGANAGFINFWREPIFANDCTTVRGNTDWETFVILQFLKLRQDYILNQARGSAQPHVYPKDLASLKILIPNINLFETYGKKVFPLNEKISINENENQKLTELRDWLLPMLMNGQVKVTSLRGKKQSHQEPENNNLGLVAEDGEKYEKE